MKIVFCLESCHMDTSCRISDVGNDRKIDADLNVITPGNEASNEIFL